MLTVAAAGVARYIHEIIRTGNGLVLEPEGVGEELNRTPKDKDYHKRRHTVDHLRLGRCLSVLGFTFDDKETNRVVHKEKKRQSE